MTLIATTVGVVAVPAAWARSNRCFGQQPTIVGTWDRDHIVGTSGNDVIAALGSDDWVEGRGGRDVVCGGTGDDWIEGGPGKDRLDGGRQVDVVFGDAGEDRLRSGGTGPYHFGDDRMFGGNGDDDLAGDRAPNQLFGGPGDDVISGNGAEFDCECVTSFSEYLVGGGGNDVITGGALDGENVDNQFFVPGPGDDVVDSGRPEEDPGSEDCGVLGTDPCAGMLEERDVVDYTDAPQAVTVDLMRESAAGEGHDTLIGIDAVIGSRFDDVIAGDDTANVLLGGDGFGYDRLSGAGSNDLLRGGYGNDALDGGGGVADEGYGDSGTDTCDGIEHRDGCEP